MAALVINAIAMARLTSKAVTVPLWRTIVPALPGAVVTLCLGAAYLAFPQAFEPRPSTQALATLVFIVVVGLVLGSLLLYTPRLVLTPDLLEIRARLLARYSRLSSTPI